MVNISLWEIYSIAKIGKQCEDSNNKYNWTTDMIKVIGIEDGNQINGTAFTISKEMRRTVLFKNFRNLSKPN